MLFSIPNILNILFKQLMEAVHFALVRLILNYNNSKVNQNQFNKIHIYLRYDNNAI